MRSFDIQRNCRTRIPLWAALLLHIAASLSAASSRPFAAAAESSARPVLVVGATGRVGRRVVQQLLSKGDRPVRALVRNATKADQLFGNEVEIFVADLGTYDDPETHKVLDRAVQDCDSIISVSGVLRFSKPLDFLPWRLFQMDVSRWCSDRTHPYYANYRAQALLVQLAERHGVRRMVRLTALSAGSPAFNLVSILFSAMISMSSRYHFLAEERFRASSVPSFILRPGGLTDDERDVTTTALQLEPSGLLPPPARVGRSDVAALCVSATDATILDNKKHYAAAVRWVGEGVPPSPQGGVMSDGCADAAECIQWLATLPQVDVGPRKMKPYGVAVGLVVYTVFTISTMILVSLCSKLASFIGKPKRD